MGMWEGVCRLSGWAVECRQGRGERLTGQDPGEKAGSEVIVKGEEKKRVLHGSHCRCPQGAVGRAPRGVASSAQVADILRTVQEEWRGTQGRQTLLCDQLSLQYFSLGQRWRGVASPQGGPRGWRPGDGDGDGDGDWDRYGDRDGDGQERVLSLPVL